MGAQPPTQDDSTLDRVPGAPLVPEATTATGEVEFEDVEGERLFGELRARLFARDSILRVGRYELIRRLGAGAMGEVHLARDVELDRLVAIKFVHPHLASERWAAGLRSEARALARLAHPNVVHVYEVGSHRGRVFLAMEYIEGASLREWILAETPSWEAVVSAYLLAARGLAAAHGAKVIHRDFKPDNVLRGRDARVAVADFGLAALDRELDGSITGGGRAEVTLDGRDGSASRTSELKGTPAYMPPEQFRGRGGPAADQFALCVAIYEGVYGHRPFPRRSLDEVLDRDFDWTVARPPSRTKVPRWLLSVLERGLATDPEQRWPDLDALIRALERGLEGPRRRARWAWTGVAAAVVGILSGVGVATLAAAPVIEDCTALAAELDGVWDAARREELERGYGLSEVDPGQAWMGDSVRPVVDGLERWRERWLDARQVQCEAQRGGDPALSERHGACLDRQRRVVAATLDLILDGGEDGLLAGPGAIQRLPDPRACLDVARSGGPPAPPAALADEVAAIRAKLEGIEAQWTAGRDEDARRAIVELGRRVEALELPAIAAEHALLHGQILLSLERAEDGLVELERAADLGEAGRHDRLVADSWRRMAAFAATRLRDVERGQRWLRRAHAASERVGLDELGRARLDFVAGNLELAAHRPERAVALLSVVRDQFVGHGELLEASHAAADLGVALLDRGQGSKALAQFEDALAWREQVYGARHPEVAWAAYNLGQAALAAEHEDLARSLLGRAVAIWTESASRAGRVQDRGRARFVLAQFELDAGEFEAGLALAQAAGEDFESILGPDRIEHAEVAALVATASYFLRRPASAVAAYRKAVAGYAAVHGDDDLYTANFRVGLGWALLLDGSPDEAAVAFEQGLSGIEAHAGVGTEASADARHGLVAVALARGQARAALAALEAAGAPPSGDMDRLAFELFFGLAWVRLEPGDAVGLAALARACDLAAGLGVGAATVAALLDSVGASPGERALCQLP